MGIVSRINVYLHSRPQEGKPPQVRTVNEVTLCTTALDASKEAIRKNWEYLRDVNLNDTDLSGIQLYEADVAHGVLNRADLRRADLRCANFAGTQISGIQVDDNTRLNFLNVGGSDDPSQPAFPSTNPHVLHLSDTQWQNWRKLGFPLDDHFEPVFDIAKRCIRAPCDNGVPDPSDFSQKPECK